MGDSIPLGSYSIYIIGETARFVKRQCDRNASVGILHDHVGPTVVSILWDSGIPFCQAQTGAGSMRVSFTLGRIVSTSDLWPISAPLLIADDAGSGAGQKGIVGASGLNNIGLLARTCGRVTAIDPSSPAAWLAIDDGSGVGVKCVVPGSVTINRDWQYVSVTGISSCEKVGSDLHRLLRVREQGDITPAL